MARSIRGAVTEENLKSVRRERRSGGWGRVDKKPWKLGRWGGGERGSKALATGFTPVESRHLSLRTCFSKNVRFSTERRRA